MPINIQRIRKRPRQARERSSNSSRQWDLDIDLQIAKSISNPPLRPVAIGPECSIEDGDEVLDGGNGDEAEGWEVSIVVEGAQGEVIYENGDAGEDGEDDGV